VSVGFCLVRRPHVITRRVAERVFMKFGIVKFYTILSRQIVFNLTKNTQCYVTPTRVYVRISSVNLEIIIGGRRAWAWGAWKGDLADCRRK
jgi:hypothetical protein